MTWDTFLKLRGTKGIYLDHVATLRPSKSYGWVVVVVVVVAHKILVSAQGPLVFGIWVWGLGVWGLGLTIGNVGHFVLLLGSPQNINRRIASFCIGFSLLGY